MSDRFEQWDKMAREQRACEDAYQTWLRELDDPLRVHSYDYAVDDTPPKMSLWQRIKLLWRYVW